MPRILFVAMSNSIHTARWIHELEELGWDIHLFPSWVQEIHPAIKDVTVHGFDFRPENINESVRFAGAVPLSLPHISNRANIILKMFRNYSSLSRNTEKTDQEQSLIRVIKKIKPDIIHTLEMQHAGYLALKAKEIMGDSFPPWIYTPWGSDIYLFGRLTSHREKIKKMLAACDYFGPKSKRDIRLAKEFGFKGEFLPVLPGNGGLDTTKLRSCWQPGRCSDRKVILVKGYQGVMNRALVALHAIEMCSDILKDYSILIYSAVTEDVKIKTQLISHDLGIPITILSPKSHEEMLNLYGQARISIGLSISDGVPNSLLESMVMGTFPIESNTSCANEWITHGETGFIVPPEDPERVAEAIRNAVTNDNLINQSAEVNFRIAQKRIDNSVINPQIIALYTEVYKKIKTRSKLLI